MEGIRFMTTTYVKIRHDRELSTLDRRKEGKKERPGRRNLVQFSDLPSRAILYLLPAPVDNERQAGFETVAAAGLTCPCCLVGRFRWGPPAPVPEPPGYRVDTMSLPI